VSEGSHPVVQISRHDGVPSVATQVSVMTTQALGIEIRRKGYQGFPASKDLIVRAAGVTSGHHGPCAALAENVGELGLGHAAVARCHPR
jgi:hypothetical protein